MRARRPLVFFAVLVLLGSLVWRLPGAFRNVDNRIAAGSQRSQAERDLGPARAAGLDGAILIRAAELIPRRASYAVITGPDVHTGGPLAAQALRGLAGYWLLPRRQAGDLDRPRPVWVLSYGGDLRSFADRYRRITPIAPGVAVAEVRR